MLRLQLFQLDRPYKEEQLFSFMRTVRPLPRIIKAVPVAALLLIVVPWVAISSKVIHFSLAKDREYRWELNRWYSGRCMFSYYEGGVRRGVVRTYKGLFEWPIAVFPGPDVESVICLYELDTTVAVFVIDLTKQSATGIPPPERLRDTVLYSNFGTRACTKAEVAYLRNYISSNSSTLWKNAFKLCGQRFAPAQAKQDLLRTVALGTIPYEERDVTWRDYSKPQLLPEN